MKERRAVSCQQAHLTWAPAASSEAMMGSLPEEQNPEKLIVRQATRSIIEKTAKWQLTKKNEKETKEKKGTTPTGLEPVRPKAI